MAPLHFEGSEVDRIVTQKQLELAHRKNSMIVRERERLLSKMSDNDLFKYLSDDVKAKLTLISDDTEFIVISRKDLIEIMEM